MASFCPSPRGLPLGRDHIFCYLLVVDPFDMGVTPLIFPSPMSVFQEARVEMAPYADPLVTAC